MKFFELKKINALNNAIWGENPFTFYFSFHGFFNRSQFFGALITLNLFLNIIIKQNIWGVSFLCMLIGFYSSLAIIQKRCRDLKLKGYFSIIIFSLAYPMGEYVKYIKNLNLMINEYLEKIFAGVIALYLLIYIFLQFMPGAKEKDINLTCPLLKHPNIYFITCIAIFSIAFWAINSFYQL